MISDERHAVFRKHVEHTQPGSDSLLRIGIEYELDTRPLDDQTEVARDVSGITQRLAGGRDEINGVADGVAERRHRLNARHDLLSILGELDMVAVWQQLLARI